VSKEGGGTPHGQTPSNRVKPRFCSKKTSYGSTETEQIKSGPLCGLSRPTVSSQTQSNQIKPNQTCPREKLAEIGLCCDERDGGTSHGQTPSNRVKPRFCSKKSSYGWTETEQIKSGPLCGQSEQIKSGPLCGLSRPTVSSQTRSNDNRSFQPLAPVCQAWRADFAFYFMKAALHQVFA